MNEKKPAGKKALLLILGILLALGVAVGLYFGVRALIRSTNSKEPTAGTETPSGSASVPASEGEYDEEDQQIAAAAAKSVYTEDGIGQDDERLDKTAAVCGKYSIDNRQAQIFYCFQYFNFMSNYGAYAQMFGLDESQPLSGQPSTVSTGDESVTLSWEQYFLMAGMEDFHQYAAAASKAEAEGYTLSEEDAKQLQDAIAGLREDAAAYENPDAYIQESFGPSVRMEDFEHYLELYFLGMSYENHLYESIELSDEKLQAYYEAHPEEFQGLSTDKPNVAVRHILILSDPDNDGTVTDEEKATAEAKAKELLQEYLKEPTEEHFAKLAEEHSEDPGSKDNGGLYDDVAPGQMVQAFNDWCFDETRKPGDNGLVETEYGFHLMYFVKQTEVYQWRVVAEQNYPMGVMDETIRDLEAEYPVEIRYADIVLSPLPKPEQTEEPTQASE